MRLPRHILRTACLVATCADPLASQAPSVPPAVTTERSTAASGASAADTTAVLALVLAGSAVRWGAEIRVRVPDPCRVERVVCVHYGFWLADSARGQRLLDSLMAHVPAPSPQRARPGVPTYLISAPRFAGDTARVHVSQRGGQPGPGGGGFAADWWVVLRRAPGPVGWEVVGWRLARIT